MHYLEKYKYKYKIGDKLGRIVVRISIIIFITELVIMFAFINAPTSFLVYADSNPWVTPIVDSIFLTTLAAPLIYFGIVKSFVNRSERSEKQLRELKTVLDLLPDRVYVNAASTLELLYLNRAALRAHELPYDYNYFGQYLTDFNKNIDVKSYRKRLTPLIKGEKQLVQYEREGLYADHIEVTHQFVDVNDETPRFVTIIKDISEHKKVEKAKSEFLATVSHELRTPLTSIKGAIALARNEVASDDPKTYSKMLNIAFDNCDQLSILVDDILSFEKLVSEKTKFECKVFRLDELVQRAVNANEGYASKFNVSLSFDNQQQPIFVKADKDRILQVLNNLISNAAKFNRSNGFVKLSAAKTENNAVVSVEDSGPGIPEKAKSRIFDQFTQIDSTNIRKAGGTGLGLSISKKIIEGHSGRIYFESTLNKGSTFFFELPLDSRSSLYDVDSPSRGHAKMPV